MPCDGFIRFPHVDTTSNVINVGQDPPIGQQQHNTTTANIQQNILAAAGGQYDEDIASTVYLDLPHPVVYKLRICCLDDFIPFIPKHVPISKFFAGMASESTPFYKSKKLELPSSGVAYLFRGRKYLLVENIDHPAAKYIETTSASSSNTTTTTGTTNKVFSADHDYNDECDDILCLDSSIVPQRIFREPGLYELEQLDTRDIDEIPLDDKTNFIFSFNMKPEITTNHYRKTLQREILNLKRVQGASTTTPTIDGDSSSDMKETGSLEFDIKEFEDRVLKEPLIKRLRETNNNDGNHDDDDDDDVLLTPCKCQLIRLRQILHRELFAYHATSCLTTIKSIIKESSNQQKQNPGCSRMQVDDQDQNQQQQQQGVVKSSLSSSNIIENNTEELVLHLQQQQQQQHVLHKSNSLLLDRSQSSSSFKSIINNDLHFPTPMNEYLNDSNVGMSSLIDDDYSSQQQQQDHHSLILQSSSSESSSQLLQVVPQQQQQQHNRDSLLLHHASTRSFYSQATSSSNSSGSLYPITNTTTTTSTTTQTQFSSNDLNSGGNHLINSSSSSSGGDNGGMIRSMISEGELVDVSDVVDVDDTTTTHDLLPSFNSIQSELHAQKMVSELTEMRDILVSFDHNHHNDHHHDYRHDDYGDGGSHDYHHHHHHDGFHRCFSFLDTIISSVGTVSSLNNQSY